MASEQSLPLLLKQLGLPMMLRHVEAMEQQAIEQQWSPAKFLSLLCEKEIANRYQKRVARHTKESKLPPGKTLGTFSFDAAPSLNAQAILALAEHKDWVQQAKNVILFGPSGVGKTHLACAIAYRMIEQGARVLFTSTMQLVQTLQIAKQQFKLPEALVKLARFPLLVLDDIGYVKKDESETSVLFELIADRYESRSLIITANQPFSEWDSIFPDNMMAVAAIDRLIHHATIFNIKEESYRQQQAKAQKNYKD
jgi:DNA replication protein DnaC